MNYIVFDLEFNQNYKTAEEREKDNIRDDVQQPKPIFEIIQIGAVKLSENLEIISTFDSLVKPVIHKELHPYVENMTKLTMDDLNDAPLFTDIINDFLAFLGDENNIFCVWGFVDIKELINNMKYYNVPLQKLPNKYIDVQMHASKLFGLRRGVRIGLKTSLDNLGIESGDDFHNALSDAKYTAQVFKKIFNENITAIKYKNSFL